MNAPQTGSTLPATLHILSLGLTNNGIIEAMQINPDDGKPVVLNGNNGAGKTTVLTAIAAILENANIAIRHGEDKATVKMELAEPGETDALFRIKRTVTNRNGKPGDALEITDREGKQISSPRKFIDGLMGSGAALDPTELMQARPGEKKETFAKRQAETIMERLGLKDKAKEMDDKIATLMEARKTLKGEVDSAQARIDAIQIPKGTPDKPIDVAKLSAEINALLQGARDATEAASAAQRATDDEKEWMGTVADLKKKLKAAEAQLALATKAKNEAIGKMQAATDLTKDNTAKVATLQTQLQNANAINAAVLNRTNKALLQTELTKKQARVDSMTKEIEGHRAARLNIVKEAKIPVEGLELTDAGLIFRGVNLEDESQGNRARICALLAVSERSVRAKILMIREGSLINTENRKIIYDIAGQEGWQVWEEHFCEDKPKEGLWIVEGELKE